MAYQLEFERLISYDVGQPGITLQANLTLKDKNLNLVVKVDTLCRLELVPPARFQRATFRLGGGRSMQLSYGSTSEGIVMRIGRRVNPIRINNFTTDT